MCTEQLKQTKINNAPKLLRGAFSCLVQKIFLILFGRLRKGALPLGYQNGKTYSPLTNYQNGYPPHRSQV